MKIKWREAKKAGKRPSEDDIYDIYYDLIREPPPDLNSETCPPIFRSLVNLMSNQDPIVSIKIQQDLDLIHSVLSEELVKTSSSTGSSGTSTEEPQNWLLFLPDCNTAYH
jgi:hypothetical protein